MGAPGATTEVRAELPGSALDFATKEQLPSRGCPVRVHPGKEDDGEILVALGPGEPAPQPQPQPQPQAMSSAAQCGPTRSTKHRT
jgi:hypothetical protein